MKLFKPAAAVAAIAGVALGGVLLAGPASADPVTGGYALTGSDTLQDSANALVNGTTIGGGTTRVAANGVNLGSFDAFGSALIRTKSTGTFFTRPSGSGEGVNSLISSINGTAYHGYTISGQVDIARSSSGPGTNASAVGDLIYVPYARDAVAYAYKAAAGDTPAQVAALGSLTRSQLIAIYSADTPTTLPSGVTVTPRLPQTGSGTRNFWLQTLGTSTTPLAYGLAVPANDSATNPTTPTQENNATALHDNEIIPFSAASWVAQSNGAAPSTIGSTGVQLGSPDGVVPFTGTGSNLVPNKPFYDTAFGRDTYLVAEYKRIAPTVLADPTQTTGTKVANPSYDAALARLLDPTQGNNSLVSWAKIPNTDTPVPGSPAAVKAKFGFLTPSTTVPARAYAAVDPNNY